MHVSLFSWPIEWCGEGILKENHRFIPGVLTDILKACDMVYTYQKNEYQRILKIYQRHDRGVFKKYSNTPKYVPHPCVYVCNCVCLLLSPNRWKSKSLLI